jgi:hypothetical protein
MDTRLGTRPVRAMKGDSMGSIGRDKDMPTAICHPAPFLVQPVERAVDVRQGGGVAGLALAVTVANGDVHFFISSLARLIAFKINPVASISLRTMWCHKWRWIRKCERLA